MITIFRAHQTCKRTLAAWLALFALMGQVLLAGGALERWMPPQVADGDLVICTDHGMEHIPADSGVPTQNPSDHSGPSCPCCLPLAAGGGVILAEASLLPMPAWAPLPRIPADVSTHLTTLFASNGPQQPRAPPPAI